MSNSRNIRWILLTFAFVAVSTSMVVLWIFPEQSGRALEQSGLTGSAEVIAETVSDFRGSAEPVLTRLGLRESAPGEAMTAPVAGAPSTAASPSRGAAPAAQAPRRAAQTPPTAVAESPVPVATQAEVSIPSTAAAAQPPASQQEAAAEPPTPPVPVDQTIYSANDVAVTPPRPLQPLLPAEPPLGVAPDSLGLAEFIVNHAGDVEEVTLLRESTRVRDAMVLTTIKGWRFDPALKEGQPVRYRQTILLTY